MNDSTTKASHPLSSLSQKQLLFLWLPLFLTWELMGFELPIAHIMLSRLDNVATNLAALGIVASFSAFIESPIFSMLSAATILITGKTSYLKLRNFNFILSSFLSLILIILTLPCCFDFLTVKILALPTDLIPYIKTAIYLRIPIPFCVGYRRFYQGILVHYGRNSKVGLGTAIRLVVTVSTMLILAYFNYTGVIVGTGGCVAGMIVEAIISRIFVNPIIKNYQLGNITDKNAISYREIAKFYIPLALTSVIATAVTPLMTFFLSRGAYPIESLAVYPVLCGITGLFISATISLHDLALGSFDAKNYNRQSVKTFQFRVTSMMCIILSLVLFSPFNGTLFVSIYDLPRSLITFAQTASAYVILFVMANACIFWRRASAIYERLTHLVTLASITDVTIITLVMFCLLNYTKISGVSAAFIALTLGRISEALFLFYRFKPNKKIG